MAALEHKKFAIASRVTESVEIRLAMRDQIKPVEFAINPQGRALERRASSGKGCRIYLRGKRANIGKPTADEVYNAENFIRMATGIGYRQDSSA